MFANALPISRFRQNLKSTFDKITSERSPFLVTRKGKEDIVVLPAEEFEGLMETVYLLKNPHNAKKLMSSLEQSKKGEVVYHSLIE
jgi:antitoxin YefM